MNIVRTVTLTLILIGTSLSAQVVINEVMINPSTGEQLVEFKNVGAGVADLSNFWMCQFPTYEQLGAGLSIEPGEFAVLHMGQSGTNTSTDWFLSTSMSLGVADGELGLYNTNDFGNSAAIVSYLQWGSGNHTRASVAVTAGIWQDANDFVPAPAADQSIGLDDMAVSPFQSSDWLTQSSPSFGVENGTVAHAESELPVSHFAQLDGHSVVPAFATGERGLASFSFNPLTNNLSYNLIHHLIDASLISINGPALAGTAGPQLFGLGTPHQAISGQVHLSNAEAADLEAGLLYIEINTMSAAGPEIRGQIRASSSLWSDVNESQEVPPTGSSAIGITYITYDQDTNMLDVRVVHDVSTVTISHIHGPAPPGTNAGVVFTLTVGPTIIEGSFLLTAGQEDDLLAGNYYINIHSTAFPSGEIRGQIFPAQIHLASLTGRQEVPMTHAPAFGLGLAIYDESLDESMTQVFHAVPTPTAAHIHGPAAAGSNAGVLFNLGTPTSPILSSNALSAQNESDLLAGLFYFNVHDALYPAGVTRGQIHQINATASAPLIAFASDWRLFSACFGTTLTIIEILEFAEANYVCPNP